MTKKKKPAKPANRVSVRNVPEARLLKEVNAHIFEARAVLRQCDAEGKKANKWLMLYATHAASLIGKLRMLRKKFPESVPADVAKHGLSKVADR